MDDDKSEMTSETEEKENSSANGNDSGRLNSEEEKAGTTQEDNDPSHVLQPFFVADTLEDDESMMIPPSQDDSDLIIPSTPVCTNKSDRRLEDVDPTESTVSVLEETCIDLENKAQRNDTSTEDANETDMTQDLAELQPTQPIIPSNIPVEHRFSRSFDNADHKKDEDEDDEDDEWQLKFSETQTQEILINYQKDDQSDKEPEPETISPAKETVRKETELEDDDLPDTLSIEVPPKIDDEGGYYNCTRVAESNDSIEAMDTPSDDEIEPSQSCLSEYKGETISASYKLQPSFDTHNIEAPVEEIPKLVSEKELSKKDNDKNEENIEIVSESGNITITLSESEPKNVFDESKGTVDEKSLSIEEIPFDDLKKNNKDKEKEHTVDDLDEKRTKDSDIEIIVDQLEEEPSMECRDSMESLKKVPDEEFIVTETNGCQMQERKLSEDKEVKDTEIKDEEKSAKATENKETKSKTLESISEEKMTNSDEHSNEVTEEEKLKPCKRKTPDHTEIMKGNVENGVEVMEINEEDKLVLNEGKGNKSEVIEVLDDSKETEIQKHESNKETKTTIVDSPQKPESELLGKDPQKSDIECDVDTTKKVDCEAEAVNTVPDSESNKLSGEILQPSMKQIADKKSETPPTIFTLPLIPERSFASSRKQKVQNKNIYHEATSVEKIDKKVSVGSYKNIKSLEKLFKSMGVTVDRERMETILSRPNEEFEFRTVFSLVNNEMFLKEYSIESEHSRRDSGVSPVCSSSTTTSSNLSAKTSSHSGLGEMADISSSLSSGKSNSCGIQMETTGHILSSQDTVSEIFPKTSTQKSPKASGILEAFGEKDAAGQSKTESNVSPIVSDQKVKSTASKRRRGKNNDESISSEASSANEPKRKRVRAKAKPKAKVSEDKSDETEESKDLVIEEKPKKASRRKKGATPIPDIKPEVIKSIVENMEISTEDDSSTQEEVNFGSILPGVKVMARWKDGYYYSGMVQRQELDGKWAVLFEDGFVHTIAPECLIKIAILPKGTSVLVQSADDFYDPGIVCGHFREDNKVGYEVELDNGVTKRHPRSAVILSGDQAKLIMSNLPPRTPSTMTINLDNLVEGKRKRKTTQSPVSNPVVKKSPRITRSRKPDSNLDSTADSSTSATETVFVQSKESESEESAKKKRKTKKGAKNIAVVSTPAATPTTAAAPIVTASTSSNAKTTKVLPQRSKKLFKDYAFLLTNADRKVVPRPPPDTSDSDSIREEEDIVPFDKDELCSHIASGGGIVLEKFEDIKKCTRKHIYLLANSYLRTMKYIQCIAAGISCIKHHWVQNCIFKSEVLSLNSYILPAGYSLVTQQVIEWHGTTDVFKGCKIALVSAPESPFVYTWAPVLLAAKADFVQKWSLPSSVSGCSLVVDVLITNNYCPPDIIQSAKRRKIPIVSSEWIIQCLIMGKKLQFDAHPKFKYDYTEI